MSLSCACCCFLPLTFMASRVKADMLNKLNVQGGCGKKRMITAQTRRRFKLLIVVVLFFSIPLRGVKTAAH